MKSFSPLRFVLLSGIAILLSACANLQEDFGASSSVQPASFMPAAQEVAPPYGFIDFCRRNRSECEGGTDKPTNPVLTPGRWAELNVVNTHVNNMMQVSDETNYGKLEYWTYPDARGGDCEDLALEKRRLLIKKGWPADALLLATVREVNGAGHAILLVETTRGEYVLDNKNWAIVAWRETPYRWNKRQSRERPYMWVDLDPHTFRVAAPRKLPPLGVPAPFLAATASVQ